MAERYVVRFEGDTAPARAALAALRDTTVGVKVTPDLRGFKTALRTEIRAASVEARIRVTPDLTGFRAALRAGLSGAGTEIKVKVVPNLVGLQARLNAESRARDLYIRVRIEPDMRGLRGRLGRGLPGPPLPPIPVPIPGPPGGGAGGGGVLGAGSKAPQLLAALVVAGAAATAVLIPLAASATLASTSLVALGPAALGTASAFGAVKGAVSGPMEALKAFSAFQKTGGVAAAEAYTKELDKLSPAGREFLSTLIDLQAATAGFKKELETAVLPGFTSFLQDIQDKGHGGASAMDIVKASVVGLGETISDTSVRLGEFASSEFFKDRLSTIIQNNQTAFESMNNAVVNLLAPITSIFTSASPLLVRFGDYLDRITGRFASFISMAERSGQLAQWFQDAGDEMAKWWGIAGDLLGILKDIFTATLPTGQGYATDLRELFKEWREWTSSTKGQEDIKKFFEDARKLVTDLTKAVGDLVLALRELNSVASGLGFGSNAKEDSSGLPGQSWGRGIRRVVKWWNPLDHMPWSDKDKPAPASEPSSSAWGLGKQDSAMAGRAGAAAPVSTAVRAGAAAPVSTAVRAGGIASFITGIASRVVAASTPKFEKTNAAGSLITPEMKSEFANARASYKESLSSLGETIHDAAVRAGNAARAVTAARTRATEDIAAAEKDIAEADREATGAQKDLNAARKDAIVHIKEMKLALVDLKEAEDGHKISLREARLEQKGLLEGQADTKKQAEADLTAARSQLASLDSSSTPQERDLAELALAQATSKLKEVNGPEAKLARDKIALKIREEETELRKIPGERLKLQTEIGKGVEGSDQVVAAVERLRKADNRASDARKNLVKTHQRAALDIAQAIRDQNEVHRDNAIAIRKSKEETNKAKSAMDALRAAIVAVPTKKQVKVAVSGTKEAREAFERTFGNSKGGLGYWMDKYGIIVAPDKPKSKTSDGGHPTQRRAAGGYIDGPGTKTSDSIPARLSKGEFVQQASAVDHYGVGFMKDLNAKRVPKFAAGGSVDEIIRVGKKAGVPLGSITTTTGKHAKGSYHYQSKAVDFGGEGGNGGPNTKKIAQYFYNNYGKKLLEEINTQSTDPYKGYYIKNGKVVSPYAAGDHLDHVHIAAEPGFSGEKGGFAGGDGGVSVPPDLSRALAKIKAPKDRSGKFLGKVAADVLSDLIPRLQAGGTGGGDPGGAGGSPSANETLGRTMAAARGWGGAQANALDQLWTRESGWRNTAQNPTSTAYGIAQFLDSTWKTVGATKTSDPTQQIRAGLKYIAQRYNDPKGAWAHSQRTGWYSKGGLVPEIVADKGAVLPPYSSTVVHNKTHMPEQVGPPAPAGAGGGPVRLDAWSIAQLAQALQSRPAQLTLDGRTIAEYVNKAVGASLLTGGI